MAVLPLTSLGGKIPLPRTGGAPARAGGIFEKRARAVKYLLKEPKPR
jgi:hypothetical protein